MRMQPNKRVQSDERTRAPAPRASSALAADPPGVGRTALERVRRIHEGS